MKLRIRVRQMRDGRFKVSYFWHLLEDTNHEYFEDAEKASQFIQKLVTKTKWK